MTKTFVGNNRLGLLLIYRNSVYCLFSFSSRLLLNDDFDWNSIMETSTHSEPEEKRTRKKASLDPTICPVCSLTIRENELQSHFKMELEKLGKVRKLPTMVNRSPSTSTSPGTSTKAGNKSDEASTSAEIDTWTTFQKIKENRVRRTTRVRFELWFVWDDIN